jgi:alpha-beta hydrolase superfamily lysophospholipase
VRLEDIAVPSLWIYASKDDVVSLPELKKYYARMGSAKKRLVEIPDAPGHVLAGAIMSPATTAEMSSIVTAFLRETVMTGTE